MYIYDDSSSEYFQSLLQAKIYLHSAVRNSLFGKILNVWSGYKQVLFINYRCEKVASRPRFEQF